MKIVTNINATGKHFEINIMNFMVMLTMKNSDNIHNKYVDYSKIERGIFKIEIIYNTKDLT